MKNVINTFLFIMLLLAYNNSYATDYFYCDCQSGSSSQCVAGNDLNSGTAKTHPKKSFDNANSVFNSMNAGDTINFCRGGAFSTNIDHKWVNNKCTSSNVCSVTAYDIPNQENPQLAPPIITQQSSNNLFGLDDGGNADQEQGYSFSKLDLRCTSCTASSNGYGFFLYNDVDYVTIKDISLNGFRIGVYLAGSNTLNAGADGILSNITLSNLTIINSKNQGILGGGNNLQITNSYFENNGNGTVFDHNIYLSSGNGILVKGNELYRSSLNTNGECAGVPLVVHGTINNLSVENNIIREDIGKVTQGCWGIAIDPGYSKAESFTNITIKNNKIINVGNIGIGLASCNNCTIENNVIFQQQSFGFTAIRAPDRARNSDDIMQTQLTIRNNSIYTSADGTGIELGTEGDQHTIVSNAIHYSGSGRFTCFDLDLPASAYTTIDNNTCYFPNALSSSEWEAGSGTTPSPIGAWQATGFGVNSQYANPDFKDPTLPLVDLSPLSSSSATVNAGHSSSSSKDYRGKTRDSQPDAGAFEYGTFNPPAKTKSFFQ